MLPKSSREIFIICICYIVIILFSIQIFQIKNWRLGVCAKQFSGGLMSDGGTNQFFVGKAEIKKYLSFTNEGIN